jgi:hypothetical protein
VGRTDHAGAGVLVVDQKDLRLQVRVQGNLDADLGRRLIETVTAATAGTDVSLRVGGVRGWTWPGLDALARCLELGAAVDA